MINHFSQRGQTSAVGLSLSWIAKGTLEISLQDLHGMNSNSLSFFLINNRRNWC